MRKGRQVPPAAAPSGTTTSGLISALRAAAQQHPEVAGLLGIAAAQIEDMVKRTALATDKHGQVQLHVSSLVSSRTGNPLVTLGLGEHTIQVSPEVARTHALHILEAAEAAETDAALLVFAHEQGLDAVSAGRLVDALRGERERRAAERVRSA